MLRTGAKSCLEVGTGSGVVRDALSGLGVAVTAIDIDEALGVDRVGDVRDLPAADGEFDVVLCSEVLEHLPWADVPKAVSELNRVCRTHAIVSVPQSGCDLTVDVTLPKVAHRRVHGRLNSRSAWQFDGRHYWQVLSRGTGRRAVREVMTRGFRLEREYTVPEFTYHRFYVLAKKI